MLIGSAADLANVVDLVSPHHMNAFRRLYGFVPQGLPRVLAAGGMSVTLMAPK